MSLYCDMGDLAERYWTDVHTARKERTCDECNKPILPGERYENARMVYEGDFSSFSTCCRCLPMAEWVVRNCGCRYHCDLWRHLSEDVFWEMRGELAPGVHFKIGRWIVEARRRGVHA